MNTTEAEAIHGWMSKRELEQLALWASKSSCIIEVGCFVGRSTRALADHAPGVVYAVDTWTRGWVETLRDADPAAFALANTYTDPLGSFLHNLRGLRNVFIYRGEFKTMPYVSPDMIFIDGDHPRDAVRRDIISALAQMLPLSDGGLTPVAAKGTRLICGHDYHSVVWPEVTRAVDALLGTVSSMESLWWVWV